MNLITISEIAFIVLTLVFIPLLVNTLRKAILQAPWEQAKKTRVYRRIVIALVIWLAFVSYWSAFGIMSKFEIFPLNFMPVIILPLVAIVFAVFFSRNFNEIVPYINPVTILNLQSFRVFVEIVLWMLFVANAIPEQMSFEGRNFDILVGLTGPIVAWLVAKNKISKTGLIVWNFAGLALLINIVTIAILSTPTALRVFFNEPANTIVAYFPSSYLPAFLVPLAYTLHFISLKQAFAFRTEEKMQMKQA